MKIYVAHASGFDFTKQLYEPLIHSPLAEQHEFVFPHIDRNAGQNSKRIIPDCDLFVAEISYPSTGLGIEIGRAEAAGVPIIAFARDGAEISSSIGFVTQTVIRYYGYHDLVSKLQALIDAQAS